MNAADAALAITGLVLLWSLFRAHRDPATDINLFDLLLENGKLSKVSVAFMVTLTVTSWVVIRLTLDGKLTDVLFAGYAAAWIVPLVACILNKSSTDSVEKPKAVP